MALKLLTLRELKHRLLLFCEKDLVDGLQKYVNVLAIYYEAVCILYFSSII